MFHFEAVISENVSTLHDETSNTSLIFIYELSEMISHTFLTNKMYSCMYQRLVNYLILLIIFRNLCKGNNIKHAKYLSVRLFIKILCICQYAAKKVIAVDAVAVNDVIINDVVH